VEASFEATLIASTEVTAKAVYEVTYEGEIALGDEGELITRMVVVNRPPDRRVDTYSGHGQERLILLNGELIECIDGSCHPIDEDARPVALGMLRMVDFTIGLSELLDDEDEHGVEVRPLPGRVIAGLEAECFEARWRGIVNETCFSLRDSVVLLSHVRNPEVEFAISMQATSVDFQVRDEDLSPTAPVEAR
jgi:hypothetical protein